MKRRIQLYVLIGLLAIVGFLAYRSLRGNSATGEFAPVGVTFVPLDVDDPSPRWDLLDKIRKLRYSSRGTNVFLHKPVPPPPMAVQPPAAALLPIQTGPPPLDLPYRFFGYATNLASGNRRAFFQNGEDIFIVAEGETLQSRFRLLRITPNTAEFEEVGSGRRATLQLEEGPAV